MRSDIVKITNFQGLKIDIEFPKGSKRPYRDDQGVEKFKTMHADYGEVAGTEGLDGDPIDVYVGPDRDADKVYVITQMKKGDWEKVDEEKCMLGTNSSAEAKKLYLAHYNDPRFCGAIKEMTMAKFLERLETRAAAGKKIASAASRAAEINYLRLSQGLPALPHCAGVKVALELPKKRVLGDRPAVDEVPAMTPFGELQPDQKVAADPLRDIAPGVKSKLKGLDPDAVTRLREYATEEVELTELEQRGIGIPPGRIAANPKDGEKLRKAAAMVFLDRFMKQARDGGRGHGPFDSTKEASSKEQRKRNQGRFFGGLTGGAIGQGLVDEAASDRKMMAKYDKKVKPMRFPKSKRTAALVAGATLGAVGGDQLMKHLHRSEKKSSGAPAGMSDRAARIAGNVDNVGIAALASPYIADGIVKHVKPKGRYGAIARGAKAFSDKFKKRNRYEVAGLIGVSSGGTKAIGKGIDKVLPGGKEGRASAEPFKVSARTKISKGPMPAIPKAPAVPNFGFDPRLTQQMQQGARQAPMAAPRIPTPPAPSAARPVANQFHSPAAGVQSGPSPAHMQTRLVPQHGTRANTMTYPPPASAAAPVAAAPVAARKPVIPVAANTLSPPSAAPAAVGPRTAIAPPPNAASPSMRVPSDFGQGTVRPVADQTMVPQAQAASVRPGAKTVMPSANQTVAPTGATVPPTAPRGRAKAAPVAAPAAAPASVPAPASAAAAPVAKGQAMKPIKSKPGKGGWAETPGQAARVSGEHAPAVDEAKMKPIKNKGGKGKAWAEDAAPKTTGNRVSGEFAPSRHIPKHEQEAYRASKGVRDAARVKRTQSLGRKAGKIVKGVARKGVLGAGIGAGAALGIGALGLGAATKVLGGHPETLHTPGYQ